MKELIFPLLAIVAFVTLSACTTVNEKNEPTTHSTTTTETQSIR